MLIPAGLIGSIAEEVEIYFKAPQFDSSHDFNHIRRVLGLARSIWAVEMLRDSSQSFDLNITLLSAYLHDVGDSKYLADQGGVSAEVTAESLLLKHGASAQLARTVQTIVSAVSYSKEIKDPKLVQDLITQIPELAIVQDADRLDAMGAIGIGRCFTYGGAKRRGMVQAIEHFSDKLLKLHGMMKTETGKKMAKLRTDRLKTFMDWWQDEAAALSP